MSFSGLIRIVVISMYLFPGSAKIFNEDRDDLQRTFVWEAFIFA